LLTLVSCQLYFGALVAGLRAGGCTHLARYRRRLSFHPPRGSSSEAPWWRNLFDNTLTVQFEHA